MRAFQYPVVQYRAFQHQAFQHQAFQHQAFQHQVCRSQVFERWARRALSGPRWVSVLLQPWQDPSLAWQIQYEPAGQIAVPYPFHAEARCGLLQPAAGQQAGREDGRPPISQ
jgi:hypothetical protein